MGKKRGFMTQVIRHLIQLIAFILFPGLFITVFSAVRDLLTALITGSFSVRGLSAQIIIVITVFLITILWGRFFCGFLCSFGTLQELIAICCKKIFSDKMRIPAGLDRGLKFLKHFILAFIVAGVWILALPVDSSLNPWGVFGMLVSGNLSVVSSAIPTIGFALLAAILVGSIFVERFFCRYLCPLGALFTIVSWKRFYKIRRQSDSCTNCGFCAKKCSMGIDVPKKEAVLSGECINCMQCITACKKESLSARPAGAVAGTAAAAVIGIMVVVGNLIASSVVEPVSKEHFIEKTQQGKYEDGVFIGTGSGFRGETKVQVTVENGYITEISVLSFKDDKEFFQKAQVVISTIIAEQTLDVDGVSGATFSSDSIIAAVSDALDSEFGTAEEKDFDANAGNGQKQPDITSSEESLQAAEQETQQPGSQDMPQPADDVIANPSGETGEQTTFDLASIPDGTYEGTGTGYRGSTVVSVLIANGTIADITVQSYQDDPEYFTRAQNIIVSEMIDAQSLDVQAVSGATFSSNSIIEAVADALFSSSGTEQPADGSEVLGTEQPADGSGGSGHEQPAHNRQNERRHRRFRGGRQ